MADPQVVARARARAQEGPADRHATEHRDADVERPRRGIAANEFDAVRIGQREQPARKTFEKALIDMRHRQRQCERQRCGAAGRQVRQVHGQRLVPEPHRRDGGQEMPALDQHVARHRELLACGQRCEQRAVVTDAEHGALGCAREVACDQVEFAERHGVHGRYYAATRGSAPKKSCNFARSSRPWLRTPLHRSTPCGCTISPSHPSESGAAPGASPASRPRPRWR